MSGVSQTLDTNLLVFTYLFVYNFSLILFFWVLMLFVNSNFQTLYKLNYLSYNFYTTTLLTILFMSMAGVPPFIGFFSKLFIIILLVNNSFFLLYSLIFIVFFVGLYFYIQNIRYLQSTNHNVSPQSSMITKYALPVFGYISFFIFFLTCLGFLYIDDLLSVWLWISNS